MRVLALQYHDVVVGDPDESGFPGGGPARYKLSRAEFDEHLRGLQRARPNGPGLVPDVLRGSDPDPFLLTFDDGGSSAVRTAEMLDALNWRGHFFVTVEPIGTRGFVTSDEIRDLRRRGHLIGSHSFSHPDPMSGCAASKIREEWDRSLETLADILGEKVDVASVPGGAYSRAVAKEASAAGVRFLFTSEPITRVTRVDGCAVLGRFTLIRGASPGAAADLAKGRLGPRMRQFLVWNARKAAKRLGGRRYLELRRAVLARRARQP